MTQVRPGTSGQVSGVATKLAFVGSLISSQTNIRNFLQDPEPVTRKTTTDPYTPVYSDVQNYQTDFGRSPFEERPYEAKVEVADEIEGTNEVINYLTNKNNIIDLKSYIHDN